MKWIVTPINPERINKLMEFGLTEYQCRAYLALLDLGKATASQIPPISRVPRTRIYATMTQLHEKGLVEIIPETPLKYSAVPFSHYLEKLSGEHRQKALTIDSNMETLAKEFAIHAGTEPEEKGRFEAIYGRRNARERLIKMYDSAKREIMGIGTRKSPGRILKAFKSQLEDKSKAGLTIKYAFPSNASEPLLVKQLTKYARIRNIDFEMPVYLHVVDRREFFMSHPIPDDESFYIGDDICIWTNDLAISRAIGDMVERIWAEGKEINARD